MIEIDLDKSELRDLNATLHSVDGKKGEKSFKVINPNGSAYLRANAFVHDTIYSLYLFLFY